MTTLPDPRHRFHGRNEPVRHAEIRAAAPEESPSDDPKVAVLRLYDPIDDWGGPWGVSAKEFTAALDDLDDEVAEIQLHVNSPGGIVFEGITIVNALRQHRARVVAVVDGIAASIASVIVCAADEVVMGENSMLMIHDASGVCLGNAGDMRALADVLDKLSDNIASVYASKAGGDVADWRAVMRETRWYTADEAVETGLADRVESPDGDDEQPTNEFDLSIWDREPAPRPEIPDVSTEDESEPVPTAGMPEHQRLRHRMNRLRQTA